MNIGQFLAHPTQTLRTSLAIGSAPQYWLRHLEPSLSWIYLFTHNQAQHIHKWINFKPGLCRGPLYGDSLNELTQAIPTVSKETDASEIQKKQILKNVRHQHKDTQDLQKKGSPAFQSKQLMKMMSEAAVRKKTRKAVHFPESSKQVTADTKLFQLAGGENFQATLAAHKKHRRYSVHMDPKAGLGALNTIRNNGMKTSREREKGTVNIDYYLAKGAGIADNWIRQITNRVIGTLRDSYQLCAIANGGSKNRKEYASLKLDKSNQQLQVQKITDGKRVAYELLAEKSGFFESDSIGFTPANNVVQANKNSHSSQQAMSSKSKTRTEQSLVREEMHYQDLKTSLLKQQPKPTLSANSDNETSDYQATLSGDRELLRPALQREIEPEQLLSRLTAAEEYHALSSLQPKTDQSSSRGGSHVSTINHQSVPIVDDSLSELADKVKRILNEEARRYGIDV